MALKKFPGFIDAHVHLRDPGATHKEDFSTGTKAAAAGGFTYIIDMPNNATPTFTKEKLQEKITLVKEKAIVQVGFHFGTNGLNIAEFPKIWSNKNVFGLKIYCNHTTGELLIEDLALLEMVFAAWKSDKPILVHAEGMQLAGAIALAKLYGRRLHVCHISQASEVELVRQAKAKKLPVTAGVTPHHLFLVHSDMERLGSYAMMKPPLGTEEDRKALWQGIQDKTIDIVETDHAPHTKQEKSGEKPMYGVPGLETAVGLLFKAVHENKIMEKDVIRLLYTNPKKIFNIPTQKNTYVELDPSESYVIGGGGYETKCGWSPFTDTVGYGKVKKVVLHGRVII
jgi:carbamoyl-phosphate synthase/aspartate carbamoyltransferase/dihydroorotase